MRFGIARVSRVEVRASRQRAFRVCVCVPIVTHLRFYVKV